MPLKGPITGMDGGEPCAGCAPQKSGCVSQKPGCVSHKPGFSSRFTGYGCTSRFSLDGQMQRKKGEESFTSVSALPKVSLVISKH